MKNKTIRLKTAGVLALPILGILLGFFSGVTVAKQLYQAHPHPNQVAVPCSTVILLPDCVPEAPVCAEPAQGGESNLEWRSKVDQTIKNSLKTESKQSHKTVCFPHEIPEQAIDCE